jgi:outer membrane protein OmpA-like peptidoglycan-associated protein
MVEREDTLTRRTACGNRQSGATQKMKNESRARTLSPGSLAMIALASAIAIPAIGQQTQPSDSSSSQSAPAATSQQTPSSSTTTTTTTATATSAPQEEKEGFWGHMNPMARKKWVKKRLEPMNDRLTELDQVNAKNASDIKDVDSRAQAGIKKAQDSADQANQTATAANDAAKKANDTAVAASGHVDSLNTTVIGIDNYKPISDVEVPFKGGSPALSKDAKAQLDDMAKSLAGHKGYVIEIESHSPSAGAAGIQSSQRQAEAVKRYLVTEHDIPVYRMHTVALGNAQAQSADQSAPKQRVKATVHIKLMENSLAAQDTTPPHGMASLTGAERP